MHLHAFGNHDNGFTSGKVERSEEKNQGHIIIYKNFI